MVADETAPELERRLSELGAEAALEALNRLQLWDRESPIGCPQNPAEATRAPRIRKEQGQADWRKPASDLRNQIRAFQPWPGTFTHLDTVKGQPLRLIIDRAAVVPAVPGTPPGTVIEADGRRLVIACGQDALSIERIQPAGKRVLSIDEFLRGYRVPVGHVFSVCHSRPCVTMDGTGFNSPHRSAGFAYLRSDRPVLPSCSS